MKKLNIKPLSKKQWISIGLGALLIIVITIWYFQSEPMQTGQLAEAGDCIPTSTDTSFTVCCFKFIKDQYWQFIPCENQKMQAVVNQVQGIDGLVISPVYTNTRELGSDDVQIKKVSVVSDKQSQKGLTILRNAFSSLEGIKRENIPPKKYAYWSTPGCIPIKSSNYCIPEQGFIDLRNIERDKYAINVELIGTMMEKEFTENNLLLLDIQNEPTSITTTTSSQTQSSQDQTRTITITEKRVGFNIEVTYD